MKIYEGISQREEFIAENPTITIEEAQAILEHHKYHSHRTVVLDDWTTGSSVRALIYKSTKDNIEIICRQGGWIGLTEAVSTKDVFDWMGGYR